MPAFSNETWDAGRASKGKSAAEYCAICLIDANLKGAEKIKAKCNLPIQYTSGGPYVWQAIRNAMGRIFQSQVRPPIQAQGRPQANHPGASGRHRGRQRFVV